MKSIFKKPRENNRSILLITVMVVGINLFILTTVFVSFKDTLFSALFPKNPSNASTRTIGPISRPIPVTIQFVKGSITSVNQSTLTVQTSSGSSNFSLVQTNDYQRITSGTFETFDAVTTPATRTDLRVGQSVMIILDTRSSGSAKAVYILR